MKLLFEQNLSHKLASLLADLFPGSEHVRKLGLGDAPDEKVWTYAKQHGYTIVTKDEDFNTRSVVRGHPPKGDLGANGQLCNQSSPRVASAQF